jgi:hypothetical protein
MSEPFTSDSARAAVAKRWRHDNQGLPEAVAKIVNRAPALTAEQIEQLRAVLPPVASDD